MPRQRKERGGVYEKEKEPAAPDQRGSWAIRAPFDIVVVIMHVHGWNVLLLQKQAIRSEPPLTLPQITHRPTEILL